jgi:hypothetical protein
VDRFYTPKEGEIKPGRDTQFFTMIDTKISPLRFIDGDILLPGKAGKVTIHFDKKMYHDGTGLKGLIFELNRFNNKSRIVGYFNQILD